MERQQAVCSRCLQRGHRVAECQNVVTCRACGVSGHKRGDPTCSGERAVNNQPTGEGGVVGWWWWRGWWSIYERKAEMEDLGLSKYR